MFENMSDHKITYKTKDGTLKEQFFDDFNEFADAIQDAASDFYETGVMPSMSVETNYGKVTKQESIATNSGTVEFIRE